MIKSMTGFASLTRDDEAATVAVTVRSVNHKFLDLQLRVPSTLAPIEGRLRALVQKRVSRGRVEVGVTLQHRGTPAVDVELNETFLESLGGALERARERGYIAGTMTPGDLLRFPQALSIRERPEADEEIESVGARVEEAVAAALDELDAMRVREGGYLRTDLDARRTLLGRALRARGHSGRKGDDRSPGADFRSEFGNSRPMRWPTRARSHRRSPSS